LQHAAKRAESLGCADRAVFQTCDVSDRTATSAAIGAAIDRAGDAPVLFYLRFFLHSIPEDVQDTLLGVISASARPGDTFAAEFRTDKDEDKSHVFLKHYRRFQNGPAFGVQLRERHNFTVLEEREGTGLAPYKDEDPELYRVIARRGG
jgi:hypothetical protein